MNENQEIIEYDRPSVNNPPASTLKFMTIARETRYESTELHGYREPNVLLVTDLGAENPESGVKMSIYHGDTDHIKHFNHLCSWFDRELSNPNLQKDDFWEKLAIFHTLYNVIHPFYESENTIEIQYLRELLGDRFPNRKLSEEIFSEEGIFRGGVAYMTILKWLVVNNLPAFVYSPDYCENGVVKGGIFQNITQVVTTSEQDSHAIVDPNKTWSREMEVIYRRLFTSAVENSFKHNRYPERLSNKKNSRRINWKNGRIFFPELKKD